MREISTKSVRTLMPAASLVLASPIAVDDQTPDADSYPKTLLSG